MYAVYACMYSFAIDEFSLHCSMYIHVNCTSYMCMLHSSFSHLIKHIDDTSQTLSEYPPLSHIKVLFQNILYYYYYRMNKMRIIMLIH